MTTQTAPAPSASSKPKSKAATPFTVGTKRESAWSLFFRDPITIVVLVVLVLMVLFSFVGPVFGGSPVSTAQQRLLPPGSEGLPLGSDNLGRDVLARVMQGGQVSLLVGVSVALLCMTVGLIIGGLAGFYGGVIDIILVKIAEFFQVIPGLILALVAAALLGANMWIIVLILSVTMWPGVARIVRAEAMRITQMGYVEAARAAGFPSLRILISDVLPNTLAPVLVSTTMTVGRAILIESALSFLGVGDANNPSWGALLHEAQTYMTSAWWMALFPGLCIFVVVLAVNILGDKLNDALNPTIGRVKS